MLLCTFNCFKNRQVVVTLYFRTCVSVVVKIILGRQRFQKEIQGPFTCVSQISPRENCTPGSYKLVIIISFPTSACNIVLLKTPQIMDKSSLLYFVKRKQKQDDSPTRWFAHSPEVSPAFKWFAHTSYEGKESQVASAVPWNHKDEKQFEGCKCYQSYRDELFVQSY